MGETPITAMRLEPELAQWAKDEAESLGYKNRTDLVSDLLRSLRARRLLFVTSPAPHFVNTGSDPEFPALICPKVR